MATIQVRDVPEDAYEVIRRRARARGQSIQAYMRDEVVRLAEAETTAEKLDRIRERLRGRPPSGVPMEQILAWRDEGRP